MSRTIVPILFVMFWLQYNPAFLKFILLLLEAIKEFLTQLFCQSMTDCDLATGHVFGITNIHKFAYLVILFR